MQSKILVRVAHDPSSRRNDISSSPETRAALKRLLCTAALAGTLARLAVADGPAELDAGWGYRYNTVAIQGGDNRYSDPVAQGPLSFYANGSYRNVSSSGMCSGDYGGGSSQSIATRRSATGSEDADGTSYAYVVKDVSTGTGLGSRDVVSLSSSVLPASTMVKIRLSVDLGLTGLIAGALPDPRVPDLTGMAKAEAEVSFAACPLEDDGSVDIDDPFATAEAHRTLEYDYSGASHGGNEENVPTDSCELELPIGTSFGLVETFSTTAEVDQSFYFVGGGLQGYTYVDGTGYAEADLYGCRVGFDVLTYNVNTNFASGYRYAQAVPEPASILPLGLGVLALVRRRALSKTTVRPTPSRRNP